MAITGVACVVLHLEKSFLLTRCLSFFKYVVTATETNYGVKLLSTVFLLYVTFKPLRPHNFSIY